MRHKHADVIHAWAEGSKLQVKTLCGGWVDLGEHFAFVDGSEYRVKPKPDVVLFGGIDFYGNKTTCFSLNRGNFDNLKLTFDTETGKLKKAEVL